MIPAFVWRGLLYGTGDHDGASEAGAHALAADAGNDAMGGAARGHLRHAARHGHAGGAAAVRGDDGRAHGSAAPRRRLCLPGGDVRRAAAAGMLRACGVSRRDGGLRGRLWHGRAAVLLAAARLRAALAERRAVGPAAEPAGNGGGGDAVRAERLCAHGRLERVCRRHNAAGGRRGGRAERALLRRGACRAAAGRARRRDASPVRDGGVRVAHRGRAAAARGRGRRLRAGAVSDARARLCRRGAAGAAVRGRDGRRAVRLSSGRAAAGDARGGRIHRRGDQDAAAVALRAAHAAGHGRGGGAAGRRAGTPAPDSAQPAGRAAVSGALAGEALGGDGAHRAC